MSNIFNSNSRFAILSEDNERGTNKKQIDRPKYDDRPKHNSNMFSKKNTEKDNREGEKIKTEKALAIENFPELVSIEKKVTPVQSYNFLEKTKPKQIKTVENNIEEVIPYGWVHIKRDTVTNKMVLKYNKDYEAEQKKKKDEEEEKKKKDEENKEKLYSYEVINALVDLYLKRTQEYIDNWGYDEYEKMFLDINHDSEYFDKLDAKYEEEMEKIREQELEQEIKQENGDL